MVDNPSVFRHPLERLPRSTCTQGALHVDIDNGKAINVARIDPSKPDNVSSRKRYRLVKLYEYLLTLLVLRP